MTIFGCIDYQRYAPPNNVRTCGKTHHGTERHHHPCHHSRGVSHLLHEGAFGGGFAIVGIPILSLVMDPVTAGGLLAPLFIAMDIAGLRYWKPSTWSKPDLRLLVPGLVAGIGVGYLLFRFLDHRAISIVMAAVTLAFDGVVAAARRRGDGAPEIVAQSCRRRFYLGHHHDGRALGWSPLAMYLLPLGLSKYVYAGTTSMFFTVGNLLKAVPWLALARPTGPVWMLMGISLLAVPTGVWLGWRLHDRLDRQQLYRACYGLLVLTATKLMWDGVAGYAS